MKKRTLRVIWMTALTIFLVVSGCLHPISKQPDTLNSIKLKPFLKLTKQTTIQFCNKKHQCRKITTTSSASSSHFKRTKKYSYVLTSLHTLTGSPLPRKLLFAIAMSGGYIKSTKTKIFLTDTFMRNHNVLKTLYKNVRADLVVLKLKRLNLPIYKIAEYRPRRKEKVYNVSSPLGLFGRGLVGVFSGRYLGQMFLRGGTFFAHTCPTTFGSSGAPILNSQGEIVGVTSSVMRGFKNVAFSSTLKDIKEIVSRLKVEK